jgi:hypothetical protein
MICRNPVIAVASAAVAVAGASAGGAQAATTCTHSVPGLLQVYMSEHNDRALLQTGGNAIRLFGSNGPVACAGTAPTTATSTPS